MIKKIIFLSILLVSCAEPYGDSKKFDRSVEISNNSPKLFDIVGSNLTQVNFQNRIKETVQLNYFNFMHLYMGAGVATADFNNDGLQDIFLVSNLFEDKLYINKGKLVFEDITASSAIKKGGRTFSTGVNVVDINSDGFMDIYICRSGPYKTGDPNLANQLYINNGDLTFTEKAKEYNLDDTSHSTQSLFLDYDKDGDLDLYLVNTPVDFRYINSIVPREAAAKDPQILEFGSSDKLFKNENGVFVDVSEASGVVPEISFGLNAMLCDINNDTYPDIHVSNDFVGPDFLFENQKDGTFKEVALDRLKHTSFYSMGSDVTDINNDGNLDLFVLDMSFKDYKKSKTSMSMGDRDNYRKMLQSNYNYQYMHNMLHLGDGNGGFSEISQLSGLDKTDWSWSCLFVDFDQDGLKDIYVTNGIMRNVLDRDATTKLRAEAAVFNNSGEKLTQEKVDYLSNLLPEAKMTNFIFKNEDGLTFKLKNDIWLSEKPGVSQGASYADFDNDGDLDIVINNTNEPATILRNLASEKRRGNSIIVELHNPESKNRFGIGAIIELEANNTTQKQIITSNRGYFSASQSVAHFGIGTIEKIEKITVTWPDGNIQTIENIEVNQYLTIDYKPTSLAKENIETLTLFSSANNKLTTSFSHRDEYSDDYQTQVLIPHRLSSYGPKLVKGDLNNDGEEDIYVPSGYKQSGMVYYQNNDTFNAQGIVGFNGFEKEETSGAIADFNGDGINDIYVGCGSYQFNKTSETSDYLLFGTRENRFINATQNIPLINTNTSKVLPFDYDQDGDLDLFIGSRVVSGAYPLAPKNYILQNANGVFEDVTSVIAPEIEYFGMVTDADWVLENDTIRLAIVGEWTGIGLFEFDGSKFIRLQNSIANKQGWWNTVKFTDLDKDGDFDIVAGNLGLNYKFKASEEKPFLMYYGDLDSNGTQEIILAKEVSGLLVPIRGKECSTEQMPFLEKKFPSFNEFANQDLFGIYGEQLNNTQQYKATMFESAVFINNGNDYISRVLPIEAQFSTVNGIIIKDINKDEYPDLILAGNMYESEIETTKADAGKGVVLLNNGEGDFKPIPQNESGFVAQNNVKSIELVSGNNTDFIFIGNNNTAIEVYNLNK